VAANYDTTLLRFIKMRSKLTGIQSKQQQQQQQQILFARKKHNTI